MYKSRIPKGSVKSIWVAILCCVFWLASALPFQSVNQRAAAENMTQAQLSAQSLSACDRIDIETLWHILRSNPEVAATWAQNEKDCYAWNEFLVLNWPSIGQTNRLPDQAGYPEPGAAPDPEQAIGDPGFVVWGRWKETKDVYLANGAQPLPWDDYVGPPDPVIEKAASQGLCSLDNASASSCRTTPFNNMGLIQQVSGLVFKSDKDNQGLPIRYELAQNQSTFDYIFNHQLYNVNGQEARSRSCAAPTTWPEDNCISFDWNASEIKASWMWVDPQNPNRSDILDRYITTIGYYQKPDETFEVGIAALTGLHIISKSLPQWVWTTFENKYNDRYTTVPLENPVSETTQEINEKYQQRLRNYGTPDAEKYANYFLVGTQIDFEDPVLLANSQIESDFQKRSSCITCHAIASVTGKLESSSGELLPLNFSFVDTSGGNLTYYIGRLPQEITDQLIADYQGMDYVWSLRLARRDRSR